MSVIFRYSLKMKKILTIMVLSLLWGENVNAQSMIPLKQYVKENKQYSKDPITLTYVLKRCGSGYLYASALTTVQDPKSVKNFQNMSAATFLLANDILMEKMNWTADAAQKNIRTDIEKMVKFYKKDGAESHAKTGSYMMGNYIGEDLKFCKGLIEEIKKSFPKKNS